jgi:hypothetical protein
MADEDAVATYVAGMEGAVADRVLEVDAAIRRAHSGLDVALKYKILMYAIAKDWRHWVVAIDARPKNVSVKFLFGVLLSDPRGVLRTGSSVLTSWDFKPGAPIDAAGIESYVREAVERYPDYRANAEAILAQAHADAAAAGRRPK